MLPSYVRRSEVGIGDGRPTGKGVIVIANDLEMAKRRRRSYPGVVFAHPTSIGVGATLDDSGSPRMLAVQAQQHRDPRQLAFNLAWVFRTFQKFGQ